MPVRPIFRHATRLKRPAPNSRVSYNNRALQSADQALATLQKRINRTLQSSPASLPLEELVQSELAKCESFARSISDSSETLTTATTADAGNSSTSTLLSLEKGSSPEEEILPSASGSSSSSSHHSRPSHPSSSAALSGGGGGGGGLPPSTKHRIAKQVSKLADSIIHDPKVFLTPGILSKYVNTQVLLDSATKIPHAFALYASKPIPRFRRNVLELKTPNPAKPSSAIPLPTVNVALNAAIAAKDLSLCFDIIDTTVCTDAFRRSKILRRTALPVVAFAMTPPAAYILASQVANSQNAIDVVPATYTIFAGILAYVGFTATIGYVAVTTANDQMDRITWAMGTPLRERWLREEERALIDRVAAAWGFQDKRRRGEEEGYDWEALREWVGLRGMVLDKPGLMEGME